MDGVGVKGKKGVGGLLGSGWMIQPLHDDSRKVMSKAGGDSFHIFSSLFIVSRLESKAKPSIRKTA